jgi:hypothetical protein
VSLDADGLALLKIGTDALPPVFRDDARVLDDLHGLAAMASKVQKVGRDMLARAMVETASIDVGGADWLGFLAGDYGTGRQENETDPVLRSRMRATPAGVIRSELLALAQAIVDAAGVVGTVAMVELPRDEAYAGTWGQDTGTGGVFVSLGGDAMKFTPTVRFAYPPFFDKLPGIIESSSITFSGCVAAGNNSTFPVTGLDHNAVLFTNSLGVSSTDTVVTWATNRIERGGGIVEGRPMAYADRGYRIWRGLNPTTKRSLAGMILILPFGCTDSTRKSVLEMLRQRAAGGVVKQVETRTIP